MTGGGHGSQETPMQRMRRQLREAQARAARIRAGTLTPDTPNYTPTTPSFPSDTMAGANQAIVSTQTGTDPVYSTMGTSTPVGTPAMGGTTPGDVSQTGDAWDGFASRYAPNAENAGMLFNNPQVIGMDVLDDAGRRSDTALGKQVDQMSQYGPDLAMLMLGAEGGMQDAYTDDQAFNMIADMVEQGITPGGRTPDQGALINNILGADLDANGMGSPLAALLQNGMPTDQVANTVGFLKSALGATSGNQDLTKARIALALNAGDKYLQSRSRGTEGTSKQFNQYLAAMDKSR